MAAAAVLAVPQKIVLNSVTSMSLNDRFTNLAKLEFPVQTVRVQMANQHQAAIKSKRLAMQMANRPEIKSELDAETWISESPTKGSLAGRLGRPNIHNRLGVPLFRGRGGRVRGGFWRGRGRGIMASVNNNNNNVYYTTSPSYAGAEQLQGIRGAGNRARGRGRRMFSLPSYRGGYGTRGTASRGGIVGRGAIRGNWLAAGRGRGFGRGQLVFIGQRGRGVSRGGRGFGNPNLNVWRSPRGTRGAPWSRGWTRGAGRGRGGSVTPVTQQLLDNQIDDYMSKTRLNLDSFV